MSITTKQDGYTLVELLVTLIVGAILIASTSLLITNQSYIVQRAKGVTVANSFIENKVEGQRSKGYLGLVDGTTNITSELPSELASPRSGSMVIASYAAGIKKVDLSVTYNEQGSSRTYTYTTYVGELGVGQY